jgi:hypothetical protein
MRRRYGSGRGVCAFAIAASIHASVAVAQQAAAPASPVPPPATSETSHANESAAPSSASPASASPGADNASGATVSSSAPAAIDPELEARRLFQDSVGLLQDGRYRDALDVLERARALREVPAVLYNLALAQRGVGRLHDAIATLRRYETIAADRLDESRRAAVNALIAQMQADFAHVTIRVRGVGVRVSIDGSVVPRDALNAPIEIDPLPHVFRADGNGLRAIEVTRDASSRQHLDVELAPERIQVITSLTVSAPVATADVFVDGVLTGTGSYESEMRPGRHEVAVRARGYLPYETLVMLRPGQSVFLQARLARNAPWYTNRWLWLGLGAVSVGVTAVALGYGLSGLEDPLRGNTGIAVGALRAR